MRRLQSMRWRGHGGVVCFPRIAFTTFIKICYLLLRTPGISPNGATTSESRKDLQPRLAHCRLTAGLLPAHC
eukprot:gene11904-biopygen1477